MSFDIKTECPYYVTGQASSLTRLRYGVKELVVDSVWMLEKGALVEVSNSDIQLRAISKVCSLSFMLSSNRPKLN